MGHHTSKQKHSKIQEEDKEDELLPGPYKSETALYENNTKARRIIDHVGTHLDLRGAGLHWIPLSLCNRIELTSLDLSNNPLQDYFREEMTNLVNLRKLFISKWGMTSIPNSLLRMDSIITLYIDGENLHDCYSLLNQMTNLKNLRLTSCNIENFENMDDLTQLESLSLTYNKITGSYSSIGSLISLQKLEMICCNLNSFNVDNADTLIHLNELNLEGNSITHIGDIQFLPSLTVLKLDGMDIQDFNPICNNTTLQTLELSSHIDWSKVPEELYKLKDLKTLQLNCSIIKIQPNLYKFKNLQELSISLNFDIRPKPHEFVGCTVLRLTKNVFDIKSIFPSLHDTFLRDIHLKEAVCAFPDLSNLENLSKLVFTNPFGLILAEKKENEWCLSILNERKLIEDNFKSRETVSNVNSIYGRGGYFILLPPILWNYAGIESKFSSNIDIIEIVAVNNYSVYILDSEYNLWYNFPGEELKRIHDGNDTHLSCIHIQLFQNSICSGITIDGNIAIFTNDQVIIVDTNEFNVDTFSISSTYIICIDKEGNIAEKDYSKCDNLELITSLPKIISVFTFQYKQNHVLVSCVDEFGKLWIKEKLLQPHDEISLKDWKCIEFSLSFSEILSIHDYLVLLTTKNEIYYFTLRNDVIEEILNKSIKKLPIEFNNVSKQKSARK